MPHHPQGALLNQTFGVNMSGARATGMNAAQGVCAHIDMSMVDDDPTSYLNLRRLVFALIVSKRIVVVAGAGISKSAGIPDFRSKDNVCVTMPNNNGKTKPSKDMFNIDVYRDEGSLSEFHELVRWMAGECEQATPTAFHRMLEAVAGEGRLLRLYTQNIDHLDTRLPALSTRVPLRKRSDGSWPVSVQLHGTLGKMTCIKCAAVFRMEAQLFEGGTLPGCPTCIAEEDDRTRVQGKRPHGVGGLRPRIVLYGENNADGDAIGEVMEHDISVTPDLLIVVGTSLRVPGAKRLVRQLEKAMRAEGKDQIAWINTDEPEHAPGDIGWSTIVHGQSDAIAQYVGLGFPQRRSQQRSYVHR